MFGTVTILNGTLLVNFSGSECSIHLTMVFTNASYFTVNFLTARVFHV